MIIFFFVMYPFLCLYWANTKARRSINRREKVVDAATKKKKKDHLGVYVAPETFHLKIYQV